MFETIALETDARGVATLSLNRPAKHNALSGQMISELTRALQMITQDDAIRVVILTGNGPSFCAGGDLGWMRDQMNADRDTRSAGARDLALMLGLFNSLPKPVIGKVHGRAMGGGVGLCCVCDIVFATDTATFGLTETKLGLIPATIGPYVIARLGEGAARQIFMSSRIFDAARAERLGIVSQVCTEDTLAPQVEAEAAAYLACAPGAIAAAKQFALQTGTAPTKDMIDVAVASLIRRWEDDEAQAGIAAFFDKTPPPWA